MAIMKKKHAFWLSLAIVAFSFSVNLWKCRFGMELLDEPFMQVYAYQGRTRGVAPFVEELSAGFTHQNVLNASFISPLVPKNLLWSRRSAVLVYGAVLLAVSLLFFPSGGWGILGASVTFAAFSFLWVFPAGWGYYDWPRLGLLLQVAFTSLGMRSERGRKQNLFWLLAGISAGVGVVAYNPLLVAFLLAMGAMGLFGFLWRKDPSDQGWLSPVLWTTMGGIGAILADLAYIYFSGGTAAWLHSVSLLLAGSNSLGYGAELKTVRLLLSPFEKPQFWFVLGASVLALTEATRARWLPRSIQGLPLERWRPRLLVFLVVILIWGMARYFITSNIPWSERYYWWAFHSALGAGAVASLLLSSRALVTKNSVLLASAAGNAACAAIMGCVSKSGLISMAWCFPVILIPFLGALSAEWVPSSQRQGEWKPRAFLFQMALTVAAGGGFLTNLLTSSFQDVPPKDCVTELKVAPFQGIRTSERRGHLTTELNRAVKDRHYVLALERLSGLFLFDGLESSVNSTYTTAQWSDSVQREQLKWMEKRTRFPEVLVFARQDPWEWGRPDLSGQAPPPPRKSPSAPAPCINTWSACAAKFWSANPSCSFGKPRKHAGVPASPGSELCLVVPIL